MMALRACLEEARLLLALAAPVLLAQVSMVSMGFVDMVMTGRVGPEDMAAVALAGSLWIPLVLFFQGILLAVTPITAQLRGAGEGEKSGHVIRQGLGMALVMAGLLIAIIFGLSHFLEDLGVEARLADLTARYLRAVIWGGVPFLLFVGLRCGAEGMGLMRPAMLAGFLGLLANIPCNYVLIFGKLGFPALGGVGAGYATAIVYWVMFFVILHQVRRHGEFRGFLARKNWTRPDPAMIRRIAGIGFPGALAVLLEVSLFAGVALLIAPFGSVVVAGHQVALNFSSFIFMIPLSLGIAATVRTGHGIGLKSPEAVRRTARAALLLSLLSAFITAVVTITLRGPIAVMYNKDPAVFALATHLLLYAAAYQWTDAFQVVSVGILRGYNDTRAIFFITLVAYWLIALPLGCVLGRTSLFGDPRGPAGFWIAFIVGISTAAVLLAGRLRVLERRFAANPSAASLPR